MKLTYLYQPVDDLPAAVAFYRDVLGLDEAWREGESTAAFRLPGTEVELMLDVPPGDGPEWTAGGFYAVDSVNAFMAKHPGIKWVRRSHGPCPDRIANAFTLARRQSTGMSRCAPSRPTEAATRARRTPPRRRARTGRPSSRT